MKLEQNTNNYHTKHQGFKIAAVADRIAISSQSLIPQKIVAKSEHNRSADNPQISTFWLQLQLPTVVFSFLKKKKKLAELNHVNNTKTVTSQKKAIKPQTKHNKKLRCTVELGSCGDYESKSIGR